MNGQNGQEGKGQVKNLSRIKNFLRYNAWIILVDILAFNAAYLIALFARFFLNGSFHRDVGYYLNFFYGFAPWYTLASLIVFACFKLYGATWQRAGLHDMNRIVGANVVTAALQIGISVLAISMRRESDDFASRMPISYYVIGPLIQFFLTAFTRFINRIWQDEKQRLSKKASVNTMLVGTGETAKIVMTQQKNDSRNAVRVVCVFDYKGFEVGAMMGGVPVLGELEQFKTHIAKFRVKRVILADPLMLMRVREQFRALCQQNDIQLQDFSGFMLYDSGSLSFKNLMERIDGEVTVLQNGVTTRYDNGEQALMAVVGRREIKSVSIRDNAFFIELVSNKVEPLIVFYITNRPDVALVAEKYGVDRVWVDLETRGKEERQRNLNTVKSRHSIADIAAIKPLLTRAQMMVRINSWYEGSPEEIEAVIAAGADVIMLPYWKTVGEVKSFLNAVRGRCKTSLLLETKEAVECVDEVLKLSGIDEIHIGLNDLHLSYGMSFMFEPLANGTVEALCKKFRQAGIPYGFGGIARLGDGALPAERVIMEHYRLGSTRAILSRSFCDYLKVDKIEEIDKIFRENMEKLRDYELSMANVTNEEFVRNKVEVAKAVDEIAERIERAHSTGL